MAERPTAWTGPGADFEHVFRSSPVAFLIVRADGLVMLDANAAYLDQVGLTLDDIVGRNVFEVFPENPASLDNEQVPSLLSLMRTAIDERRTTTVSGLRYDIPTGDGFEVRWWNASETPLLAADGTVDVLLHHSEDVTELTRARDALTVADRQRQRSAEMVTLQAELALALTSATTLAELEATVVHRGLTLLGASGGALLSRAEDGGWQVTVPSEVISDPGDRSWQWVPFDSPLPSPTATRRGTRILLPDRTAGLAFHPEVRRVYELFDCHAYASLPLTVGAHRLGALSASWSRPHQWTDSEIELLDGIAAQCALALDRIKQWEAQRRGADQIRALAESLQSAMLTPPPVLPDLEIVVRYRSADDVAKVGGDWYDAFVQPDGATMVVIGDVSGHDHVAAGKMGQMRGLLRALAFDAADQPHGVTTAATLVRYEHVANALGIGDLATLVLARVEVAGDAGSVRWTNAGSPPPVLLHDDGTTELLDEKPDLMIGVEETVTRREQTVELPPGATLLLYTDGLVERRDTGIDAGIEDLTRAMAAAGDLPLDQLCDSVLDQLSPHIGEDDVAMLALRVRRCGSCSEVVPPA